MKKIKKIKYLVLSIIFILLIAAIASHITQYRLVEWLIVVFVSVYVLAIIFFIFTAIEKRIERKRNQPKPIITATTEPVQPQYIETKHGIKSVDGKEFSDEEVPFLIQYSYEKAMERETVLKKVNPKFTRTEREEDLAFNFEKKHGTLIHRETKKFMDLYREASYESDLELRLEMLYRSRDVFLAARDLFYSKGKGATIFFQDMYEHMHNSRSDCFSYLDLIENSISETKRQKDVVIPDILDAIHRNDGILQKDIYSLLPHIEKNEVQAFLKSSDVVLRIKKGSTYELHLRNNNTEKEC